MDLALPTLPFLVITNTQGGPSPKFHRGHSTQWLFLVAQPVLSSASSSYSLGSLLSSELVIKTG